MKRSILNLALVALISTTALMGCKDSTKQELDAREGVEDARADLDEAKAELSDARKAATEQEWKEFKESTNAAIAKNENRISDLKMQMKKSGKTMDAEYTKKIEELEVRNREIKDKVNAYKNSASDDWETFKEEYNRDMEDLGQSFKNFTVKNN
ncbi:hypothetical protein SAMN05444396_11132 [Flavobacterium segetis]|uniref:Uncharacterized protein n=1 Tax=Flavobacterium segetis TaxID=271157 RepID=A0A1M5JJA8_9FLAO|nr:hypothetical protein [Flavobacterium segetis]SHG40485.1 hypothetical protein SAMN05444396_11132 [Flavobacterium segetis]